DKMRKEIVILSVFCSLRKKMYPNLQIKGFQLAKAYLTLR
ncbi:MAG: hypothetical protein ACI80H_001632, partial [Pseudoalteromonas distincta]